MISKKMQSTLNGQIQKEFYSSYLYLAMSVYCADAGLNGFANWFKIQAQEEATHAMKFLDYVLEQSGRVSLQAIEQPPKDFDSPLNAFKKAYEHEQFVTSSIYKIVDQAIAEKDHATNAFLQWFVTEQVEEEAHAKEIVDKLELAGVKGPGLFMLDSKLGARTFGAD